MEGIGERVDQARLSHPGDAFEEDVPAGQQTRDRAADDIVVADDSLRHLLGDAAETFPELINGLSDGGNSHCLRVK
jgi:hypothetical protein